MDNYYGKSNQNEMNQYYQRYASIEAEDNVELTEKKGIREDPEVIIDDTTIYEIDLDCYECIQKRMRNKKYNP